MLNFDKFTWAVVIVVILVLAAAVVTVNLSGGEGWGEATYLVEDTPEAVIHNAFVAFMNQDFAKARHYYSAEVLDDEQREPFPGRREIDYPDDTNRRLRIKNVSYVDDGEAMVSVVIDYYTSGGLFGGGNTWSMERVLKVIQEEGEWVIDTHEFLY
ncbi:MAG: hypothetical protein GY759_17785 [Chloroflexi bacterium]|nr:hypothetical protein [Chloroflexota bacterium]